MTKFLSAFVFLAFILPGSFASAYYTESAVPAPVSETETTQSPTSASQPTSVVPSVKPEIITEPSSVEKLEEISVPVSITPAGKPQTITVPITPTLLEVPTIVLEETPIITTEEQPVSIPVTIEVTPTQQVTIMSEEVTAITVEPVHVKEGQIFLGSTETTEPIIVLPHQIPTIVTETAEVSSIETIELKLKETEPTVPVYEIHATHEERFLWLFPISVELVFDVNATTGEAGPVSKPWWSLFSF